MHLPVQSMFAAQMKALLHQGESLALGPFISVVFADEGF